MRLSSMLLVLVAGLALTPAAAHGSTPRGADAIGAAGGLVCALVDDARVRCHLPGLVQGPVDLGTGRTAEGVTAGAAHACALRDTGDVLCWGDLAPNLLGTTATGFTAPPGSSAPVDLGAGRTARAISAGRQRTCAILDTTAVRCWGAGARGGLGTGSTADVGVPGVVPPVDLGPGRTARHIAVGEDRTLQGHVCAVRDDQRVICWGDGTYGRLGHGNEAHVGDNETPGTAGPVALGAPATKVAVGGGHSCAILVGGAVKCWGRAAYGQLGYGNVRRIGDNETPDTVGTVALGAGRTAVDIAAGEAHTCVVLDDGAVRCWGLADLGQIGSGAKVNIGDDELPGTVPAVDLGAGRTAVAIAAGVNRTCAALDTRQVRCWGDGRAPDAYWDTEKIIGDNEPPSAVPPVDLGVNDQQTCWRLGALPTAVNWGGMRAATDLWSTERGCDGNAGFPARASVGAFPLSGSTRAVTGVASFSPGLAPDELVTLNEGTIQNPEPDGDDGRFAQIPVASEALVVIARVPTATCRAGSAARFRGRPILPPGVSGATNATLERAWSGEARTWGDLGRVRASDGTPCPVKIRRVVPGGTGTLEDGLQFKRFLADNDAGATSGWAARATNASWPDGTPTGVAAADTTRVCDGVTATGATLPEPYVCRHSDPLPRRVELVEGAIGVTTLAAARAAGFDLSSSADGTYWLALYASGSTTTLVDPAREPSGYRADAALEARGANCANAAYGVDGGATLPASLTGDWSRVSQRTSPSAYPLCRLHYLGAWMDLEDVQPETPYATLRERQDLVRRHVAYALGREPVGIDANEGQLLLPRVDMAWLPGSVRSLALTYLRDAAFDIHPDRAPVRAP